MNDGMDGMGPMLLMVLLIGVLFGVVAGSKFTQAKYQDDAIKGKHAIYAPDTGKFMWLQPGDQVTR